MNLLDSNILICSYSEAYSYLRELIWSEDSSVSEISRLEVMGFHGLKESEENYLRDIFLALENHEINSLVLDEAIHLRKTYKMKIGDSIIAATAIIHHLDLYTRNEIDFLKIPKLKVVNPVKIVG